MGLEAGVSVEVLEVAASEAAVDLPRMLAAVAMRAAEDVREERSDVKPLIWIKARAASQFSVLMLLIS